LADAAVRYENYSDFGSTFNYKLASRIKVNKDLNFRFAGSTGFRAPSIHQIYYNVTSTLFTNGQLLEVGTFSNDSKLPIHWEFQV
jgi:iron complex outermembrane receptor protein